jgi:hypothetical protein
MLGKDLDQVHKQINLKGSLLRINPALGALGFGMDKKLMKGLVRELPGMLGAGGMAGLGGALGSAAGVLGPAGLVLGLMETAWHKMIDLAGAADPQVVKDYNQVWADLTAILGRLFIPAVKDATSSLRGIANILNFVSPDPSKAETPVGRGASKAWGMLTSPIGVLSGIGDITKQLGLADTTGVAGTGGAKLQSIDQYSDQLTTAAFGAEGGAQEKTASFAELIYNLLSEQPSDQDQAATNRGLRGYA